MGKIEIETDPLRSRIMSRVRGRDTAPERKARTFLHRAGFRFRLHVKKLPGRPDIVLPRHRAVVFVHGCFWHRQDCSRATTPKRNSEFWREKFRANIERDERNVAALRALGWKTFILWECVVADDRALSGFIEAMWLELKPHR